MVIHAIPNHFGIKGNNAADEADEQAPQSLNQTRGLLTDNDSTNSVSSSSPSASWYSQATRYHPLPTQRSILPQKKNKIKPESGSLKKKKSGRKYGVRETLPRERL